MNLKIKTPYLVSCVLVFVFLSFAIWMIRESEDGYRKRIYALQGKLSVAEYNWIEDIRFSSSVYNDFFKNKTSFREKTDNKTSVLIYRFSKYMCESCKQEDLQEIESFQKETGKERILLLPAYPDNREGSIELIGLLAKFNYCHVNFEMTVFYITFALEILK